MTMTEYSTRVNQLVAQISEDAALSIIVPNTNELLAKIKNRITVDGKNSDNSQIGNYGTNSAYFSKLQFDRQSSFSPRGKNNKGDFKNGKPRKTMYIGTGYKGLRDVQGKPTDKVTLSYTGSTMSEYQQALNDKEVVQGFVSRKSSEIRKGHEKKRGMEIYRPTNEEISEFNEDVTEELKEVSIKILNGVSG